MWLFLGGRRIRSGLFDLYIYLFYPDLYFGSWLFLCVLSAHWALLADGMEKLCGNIEYHS